MGLAMAVVACADPFPCNRYCWSHKQGVADLTGENMMGAPDGRFDMHCERHSDSSLWYPPLPPFGWYAAEACLPADVHQSIARTVASIQDPTIDASAACDVGALKTYAELVQTLALQARDACVAHLTCNGAPAGCDLDAMAPGPQACQVQSAEALCDQAVLAPALAALGDLSNGPGAAQPRRDGSAIEYVDDPLDCEPLAEDTDGTPVCDDGGGGADADESSSSSGLDESSSGGGGLGPDPKQFGEVDGLVSCTSEGRCTVAAELFAKVTDRFEVFYDEGVWLERVDEPGLGRGVRISGLDRGEASEELLGAVGIEDGDVLTHVDGVSVGADEGIEEVLLELPRAKAWELVLGRKQRSGWVKVELEITRG